MTRPSKEAGKVVHDSDQRGSCSTIVEGGCGALESWFIHPVRENHVENLSRHVKCLRKKNDSKNWGEAGDDGIWSPTSHPVPPVH